MSCAECGTLTNHTTAQHEEAQMEQSMCIECGVTPKMDDDPDTRLCAGCRTSELMAYYTPDEGGQD